GSGKEKFCARKQTAAAKASRRVCPGGTVPGRDPGGRVEGHGDRAWRQSRHARSSSPPCGHRQCLGTEPVSFARSRREGKDAGANRLRARAQRIWRRLTLLEEGQAFPRVSFFARDSLASFSLNCTRAFCSRASLPARIWTASKPAFFAA